MTVLSTPQNALDTRDPKRRRKSQGERECSGKTWSRSPFDHRVQRRPRSTPRWHFRKKASTNPTPTPCLKEKHMKRVERKGAKPRPAHKIKCHIQSRLQNEIRLLWPLFESPGTVFLGVDTFFFSKWFGGRTPWNPAWPTQEAPGARPKGKSGIGDKCRIQWKLRDSSILEHPARFSGRLRSLVVIHQRGVENSKARYRKGNLRVQV